MKPIGLEGKVGAPAIVRENPLRAVYDRVSSADAYRSLLESVWRPALLAARPFTWKDALEVVQERYAGLDDRTLTEFLSATIRVLPDPVLTYDLDTPELHFRVKRQSMKGLGHPSPVIRYDPRTRSLAAVPADPTVDITPGDRPCDMGRVVHLIGTCAYLGVSRTVALIDGSVRSVEVCDGLCVLRGDVTTLSILDGSFCAILPGGRVASDAYVDGVLMSAVDLDYGTNDDTLSGSVCDPDMNDKSRALYGAVVRCADNPAQLLLANRRLRDDAKSISRDARTHQDRRRSLRQDTMIHDGATRFAPYYRFTPRGGSR